MARPHRNTWQLASLGSVGAALLALGCGGKREPELAGGYHDFGTVRHGDKPQHTFVVTEHASVPIKVLGVVAQCSCARAKVTAVGKDGSRRDGPMQPKPGEELLVAPGERLELEIDFDTTLRPPVDTGPVPFTTRMVVAAPQQRDVLFQCDAKIRARIGLKPGAFIDLGRVADRQAASAILELSARDGKDFKIEEVAGLGEGVELVKLDAGPGVHRYRIDSPPGREYVGGNFARAIVFATDLDGGYLLPIQVKAIRLPPISVEPDAKISFGQFNMKKPAAQFVTVKRNSGGPLELEVKDLRLKVEKDDVRPEGHFEVRFEELAATRSVRVEVRYAGNITGRYFNGTLVLATNDPDQPTVEIEIVGFAVPNE